MRSAWAICLTLLLAGWAGIEGEPRAEGLKLLARLPSPNLSLAKAVVAQRNQKKAVFLDLGGGKKEARK